MAPFRNNTRPIRDTLYSGELAEAEPFVFDQRVVEVFDDMIRRSVPLYTQVQEASVRLALRFALPQTKVLDLGCSTGTTLLGCAEELLRHNVTVAGVDNSAPMIERCRNNLASSGINGVQLICADVGDADCSNTSVVFLNYTLQFIDPAERPRILRKIYDGLNSGGVLLISEKVRHDDSALHETLTELHHDFKRNNGYSDLEIARKRDAIENVLIPFTTGDNIGMLREAGFGDVEVYLKWYNFASMIAIKR